MQILNSIISTSQERDLKKFREDLKMEVKLLKQEVDLMPKNKRKDTFRIRKEKLEIDQAERVSRHTWEWCWFPEAELEE